MTPGWSAAHGVPKTSSDSDTRRVSASPTGAERAEPRCRLYDPTDVVLPLGQKRVHALPIVNLVTAFAGVIQPAVYTVRGTAARRTTTAVPGHRRPAAAPLLALR